jgi:Carbohydrate-binding family 9
MGLLTEWHLSSVPVSWLNQTPVQWAWRELRSLPPLMLNDGSKVATQQTEVRLCYLSSHLYIRFDCLDDDIWGNYTKRDDPIYEEEVVEIFIAAGNAAPQHYFEFEVSPKGVLFDCKIYNPSGFYDDRLEVDVSWNAEDIVWHAEILPEEQKWWAILEIPWQAIGGFQDIWRANFYRIERSSKSGTEFSSWSPTLRPNMFHVPAKFGSLLCQQPFHSKK